MLGKIIITDLEINCEIGVYDHEKGIKQPLFFDLTLKYNCERCMYTDDVKDSIDYERVVSHCQRVVQRGHYHLLERLAGTLLQELFKEFPLVGARICIKKPSAIKGAHSAAILFQQGDLT